jgi:tripartite-type tricarboxylate transporter receptor subunit TctC
VKSRSLIFLAVFIIAGLAAIAPSVSIAQKYPDKPIKIVVPNVAGSIMDLGGRMIGTEFEKLIGAKVIVDNRPGAGTVLGTEMVIRAKKDGYTLLYGDFVSAMIVSPIINPDVIHFDPGKDIEPLGFHYLFPTGIVVRADSPWKTFPEFVDYAKKNPRKIRVSTMGVGTHPHLLLEMLQMITGAQFNHVPFEGGETSVTAVLGGHVEATCQSLAKVKPHVDAGKMRILLFNTKMPDLPEIPVITELGYKQDLPVAGMGLYAAAGIPDEARNVLVPAMEKAVKNTKTKIDQLWGVLAYKTPAEQKKMWEQEYKKINEVCIKIGLKK